MPLLPRENKRIAIVSYYWPPSGGVGVRRWLYLSKHLADLGYKITVFHPHRADYTLRDERLVEDIHSDIQTISVPIFEIRKLLDFLPSSGKKSKEGILSNTSGHRSLFTRFLLYIRSNFYIPDARKGWLRTLNPRLKKFLRENDCDVLVTTGPPHSVHLAGLKMKQLFPNLKWMADFRDPWSRIEYFEHLLLHPKSRLKHLKLEQEVVSKCDILLTVSPSWKNDFEEIGARDARVITNAYDFEMENIDFEANKEDGFIYITHAGTVNEDRLPLGLFHALKQLLELQPNLREKIRLEFIGNTSTKLFEAAHEMNIGDLVIVEDFLPHEQLMNKLKRSTVLLVLINKSEVNQKGRIPAKLFEYIGLRKQILLLSAGPNDAADLIEEHNLGVAIDYENEKEQREFLIKSLAPSNDYQPNMQTVKSFHRSARAHEVDHLILQLIARQD